MSNERERTPRLPPRWFVRAAWVVHRALYRVSGGRFGLRRARSGRWGMLALTTIGRRTGQTHRVILGYLEDGPNLVTMAMNGWGEGEPAWWLNLQSSPDTHVELADGSGWARRQLNATSCRIGLLRSTTQGLDVSDPNFEASSVRERTPSLR